MRAPGKVSGCFYSGLTVAELQTALRVCKLPLSGSKADLVARLRAHPEAGKYAVEGRSATLSRRTLEFVGGRDGVQLSDLKALCKQKGLRGTGSKAELVLSLLTAAAQPAGAPAPAQPKARAPATKPADPSALYTRMLAKCQPDTSTWSQQKYKEHGERVFSAAHKLLATELESKGALKRGDVVSAARAVEAVLRALNDGFRSITRPSYGNANYNFKEMGELVKALADEVKKKRGMSSLPETLRGALSDAVGKIARTGREYALDGFNSVEHAFE